MPITPPAPRLERQLASALVALCVSVTVAGAQAAGAPAAPAVVTKITADLGYVQTSGNTQVTTLNIGERFSQQRGRWLIQQAFAMVYGKTSDTVSTSSVRTGLRTDYKIDRLFALFIGVSYDRNRFAGVERRFEEVLGVQARLLASSSDTVRVEGGGTFTQQVGTDGMQRNFPSARAAGAWRHVFSKAAYFQQNVEFVPNLKESEDWRLNSESSVVAPVSARIGVKLGYVVRYDNLPEPTFSRTDKLFTTGIQITF